MFSVLLVSNPSTLLDHTEARKAEKGVFFFWRPPTPFISGSGWPGPLIRRLDPSLVTRFRYIEVRLHICCYYWGEEDRSLYRGLCYIDVCYIEVLLYDATSAQRTNCASPLALQSLYAGSNVIQQIFGNQKIPTPHYHDVSRQSIYFHFSCFREFILYHFYKNSYYTN